MGQLNAQMPSLIQHILELCSWMLHLAAVIYEHSTGLEILDIGEKRGLELHGLKNGKQTTKKNREQKSRKLCFFKKICNFDYAI